MKIPLGQKWGRAQVMIPEDIFSSGHFDTTRTRTIWTVDGEIEVPVKMVRGQGLARARVWNIWMRDDHGALIMRDPVGTDNTITDGATWNMMNALWGYNGLWNYSATIPPFGETEDAGVLNFQPAYNDGVYPYPTMTQIGNGPVGSDVITKGWDSILPVNTLFGQLWFLDGSSGGLSGSHIPSTVTCATGFTNKLAAGSPPANYGKGWFDGGYLPVNAQGITNTSLSDSFSSGATGTPIMSHSMTLSASSGALSFTFDGIAWIPQPGIFSGETSTSSDNGYWYQGTATPTVPVWASATSSPTMIYGLQPSALWNPGFATTLNPGGSWGFTYSFEG